MMIRSMCLAALASAALLPAQPPEPSPAPKPAPSASVVPDTRYVRLFSGGLSLSYMKMSTVFAGTYDSYDATNLILVNANTTVKHYPIAGGGTFQFAFLENWAVSAGAVYREGGFEQSVTYYNGTDNPNTSIDERKRTINEQTTQVRFFEIPVLARYYSKSHYDAGVRWFAELGPNLRVTRVAKSENRIQNPSNIVTYNDTPAAPTHKTVMGLSGGFGVQITDPFGIHYLPEVRYTRWLNEPFSSMSTRTNRHQVELVLSVTF